MIICSICIHRKMSLQQNLVATSNRREKLQRQMAILLFASITSFALCTLPYVAFRIYNTQAPTSSANTLTVSALTVFLNMNYSFNFYIHCVTSKLFREKFVEQSKRLVSYCKGQRGRINNAVYPLATLARTHISPTIQ
jgi:hypothetical protein